MWGKGDFGYGKDFGKGKPDDFFGKGKDFFGKGKDDFFGKGKDDFGKGKDDFGKGKDDFGKGTAKARNSTPNPAKAVRRLRSLTS